MKDKDPDPTKGNQTKWIQRKRMRIQGRKNIHNNKDPREKDLKVRILKMEIQKMRIKKYTHTINAIFAERLTCLQ